MKAQVPARSIRFLRADDPRRWDELARALPGATAFHRWDFLDLQERLLGVVIERFTVVDGDGRVLGMLPLARRSRRSLRAPRLPFPLLGPALLPESADAVLAALRRVQLRRGLMIARFEVAPDLAEAVGRAALGARMQVTRDGTVRVALEHESLDGLDAAMGRTRRKQVRQALRAGVVARPAEPGETAAMLGRVMDAAYGARGATRPYPADIGARVEEWARGRDDVRLGSALVDGEHVGSLVTVAGHPVATAWIGSCLPESRGAHAESVLLRDGMQWASQQGSRTFEFAGRVSDGVERYKLSFGGRAAPYIEVESSLLPGAVRRALGRASSLRR